MAELKFKYNPELGKPEAMQVVMSSVQSLIEQGLIDGSIEESVRDIEFDDSLNEVKAIIDDEKMLDSERSQSYIDEMGFEELQRDAVRTYSVRTIAERLKIQELPTKKQMRYLILDYRRYYKRMLPEYQENPTDFYKLRSMFINDFMMYFNDMMPLMIEGENIAKELGLTALSPKTMAPARKLGIILKQAQKVGGMPRSLLEKAQLQFKLFIDALADSTFKGWRSKIEGQNVPEEEDEVESEVDILEGQDDMEEMRTESKEFSELQGEEAVGETMEMTPAEEELLKEESLLEGDGASLFSEVNLKKIDWKSIKDDTEIQTILDSHFMSADQLLSNGYTKYAVFNNADEFNNYSSALTGIGAYMISSSVYTEVTNKEPIKTHLVFIKDEQFNKINSMKTFSTKLPKLDWGYTNDLVKQGYNESPLTTKYLKKLHDSGFTRFYQFDSESDADKYVSAILDSGEDKYELDEVQDPEMGHVWVLFTKGSVAKQFSNRMKRFNK